MTKRSSGKRGRMPRRALLVACLGMAALALSTLPARAASLGPVSSRNLASFVVVGGTGAPTVCGWDNFTGANGTALNGRASGGGGPAWIASGGTWQLTGNRAIDNPSVAGAVASINCSMLNARAVVTLAGTQAQLAGLVVNTQAAHSEYFYVAYRTGNGGRLEIGRVIFGGNTVVLSTVVGNLPSLTLSAESNNNVIRAYVNGTLVSSYTLSGIEQFFFRGATDTRFGLFANTNATTTFDDFRTESL